MYRKMLKEEALKPAASPKIIAMEKASADLTLSKVLLWKLRIECRKGYFHPIVILIRHYPEERGRNDLIFTEPYFPKLKEPERAMERG
jgi:hypothetical protein